jgi:hypothetical protein
MWLRQWNFWKLFPNNVVGILSVGLMISGITMLLQPHLYRSFYMDIDGIFVVTPIWAGWTSLLSGAACLATKAGRIGVALVAGAFAGRGVILFTAWVATRVDPPPPPTRWIWEVINLVVILLSAAHFRRSME